jgi:hypothetical protein
MNATEILDHEFLGIRARLLELAATFDRIQRADGNIDGDRRNSMVRQGLEILLKENKDRAEQVQLLFSRQYEDDWQDKFDLDNWPR